MDMGEACRDRSEPSRALCRAYRCAAQ
ncbi:hypothetical protein EDM56_27370 [Brevibacillus fluminis]|uniref:Uncharacterized protein n=1 Tax=Brevibacillus fluminis TaxID=511487 RepID=A0A3M8CZ35_9BACL|nr:hypothetical protein EDM56_27370 [Brevibacillus fluminis]